MFIQAFNTSNILATPKPTKEPSKEPIKDIMMATGTRRLS